MECVAIINLRSRTYLDVGGVCGSVILYRRTLGTVLNCARGTGGSIGQSLRAAWVFQVRCYNPSHVKRIPSLDGLRAISISLVIAGHLANWGHLPLFLRQYANLGVRIFFVISGYLITTILLREHARTETISLRDFYVRRAYRIFPAAMCFMAVIFFLYWPKLRGYEILATVFYLANFLPYRLWILGHLWSLSVEEQFYFLWPSVLKKWYRHRTIILCAAILATPVARTMFYFFKLPVGDFGNLLTVGDTLATGCLLAALSARVPKIPWQAALAMVFALVLVPLCHGNNPLLTMFILFVLSPILHFSIAGILIHVVQHLSVPESGSRGLARHHQLQPLPLAAALSRSIVLVAL